MPRRLRLALMLAVPVLAVVLVTVHALWYAHVQTLSEGQAHHVSDHFIAVLAWLWGSSVVIAGAASWAIAGRLVHRSRDTLP